MSASKVIRLAALLGALVVAAVPVAVAQGPGGPGGLGIEVRDADGDAVAGVKVQLRFVEVEPFTGPPAVETGGDGRAEIFGLAVGRWRLDLTHPDFAHFFALVHVQAKKKPVITAGPLRDGAAPPLEFKLYEVESRPPPAVAPPSESRRRVRRQREPVAPPSEPAPERRRRAPERPAPEPVPAEAEAEATPPVGEPSPEKPAEAPVERPVEAPVEMPAEPSSRPEPAAPAPAPSQPPVPIPAPESPPSRSSGEPATPDPGAVPPASAPAEPPSPKPPAEMPPTEPPVTPPPSQRPAEPPVAPPPSSPSPTAPRPQPSVETPVPQRLPDPRPPRAVPVPGVRLESSLRSAEAGTCADCRDGEWALSAEAAAGPGDRLPAGDSDCPSGAATRFGEVARLLDEAPSAVADGWAGPVVDPANAAVDGSIGEPVRDRIAQLMQPYTGAPGCQLVAVLLPAGTRYRGYLYGARDATGMVGCAAGEECPLGDSLWPAHPMVEKTAAGTLVGAVFNNWSDGVRVGRLIVYFTR